MAKIERGHRQDLLDANVMMERQLIDKNMLRKYFDKIKPELIRYPSIDPKDFDERLYEFLQSEDCNLS